MEVIGNVLRVNGRELARRLKTTTATRRALLAADLSAGRIELHHLTRKQARAIAGCSYGYQNTVEKLDPHQRERVRNGWASLAEFHNRQKTDDQIDRFIKKVGPDRVFARYEWLTAPVAIAAE
jgi:hypothetical protein